MAGSTKFECIHNMYIDKSFWLTLLKFSPIREMIFYLQIHTTVCKFYHNYDTTNTQNWRGKKSNFCFYNGFLSNRYRSTQWIFSYHSKRFKDYRCLLNSFWSMHELKLVTFHFYRTVTDLLAFFKSQSSIFLLPRLKHSKTFSNYMLTCAFAKMLVSVSRQNLSG